MTMNEGKLPKLKGYCRVFGVYVSHKYMLAILTALLAAATVYLEMLHPDVVKLWMRLHPMPTIRLNSVYMDGYSGLAKLVDANKNLIYEGRLEDGTVTGKGLLYSGEKLIYDGWFADNKYCGSGKLYDDNGSLLYEGEFLDNEFSGDGILYENGTKCYEGQFLKGMPHGVGTEYEGVFRTYEGGFIEGEYSGSGRLYKYNILVYEGSFANGVYEGTGTLFRDGETFYEGTFLNGRFNGLGKQYENGRVVYDGMWSDGSYEGQGKQYVGYSLLYEGEFSEGKYNGDGSLYYTDTGYLKYQGRFIYGEYTDSGQHYDKKGRPISKYPPIKPVEMLHVTYIDAIELLKDAELEYKEMVLGKAPVILVESMGWAFRFTYDAKSLAPGYINTVYFSSLDAVGGALVGMLRSDIIKYLGAPTAQNLVPDASDILALTISNMYWGRSIDANVTIGESYAIDKLRITVFYDNSSEYPSNSLFFAVRVLPSK